MISILIEYHWQLLSIGLSKVESVALSVWILRGALNWGIRPKLVDGSLEGLHWDLVQEKKMFCLIKRKLR